MQLGHAQLKSRQRELRDSFQESLGLRTHRALSWLQRAEQEASDPDARFIFLWIAFNAAYANEIYDRRNFSERGLVQRFLGRLVDADNQGLLSQMVWQQFPGPIRLLIENQYVFQPFWDFQNGRLSEKEWKDDFAKSKAVANRALGKSHTKRVLGVMLERLYTLRNQIVHGGATWNSSVNRSQLKDGVAIMGLLVPTVIHLMMENGNQGWGDACYPVVD